MSDKEFHVKANSGTKPDLYARPPRGSLWEDEPCPCELLPCGFVKPSPACPFHGGYPSNELRLYAHFESECPNPRGKDMRYG